MVVKQLLIIAVLASTATAQPAAPKLESLTIDIKDLRAFVVKPEHAQLRWVTVDGCGTIPDLKPLAKLPRGVAIQLGRSECLVVERLDGIERAGSLTSFAVVNDASALAKAAPLRQLALHNAPLPIADLLALPPDIESLDVNLAKSSRGEIRQLLASPLVGGLDSLSFSVSEVPVLPPLPRLRSLSISMFPTDTRRADLGFLRNTPDLKHLRIGGVQQAALAPILALRELETLDVAGLCRIDARPLARLPKLTWVTISMLVEETHKPVRSGLEVHRSNPYALCSPPKAP